MLLCLIVLIVAVSGCFGNMGNEHQVNATVKQTSRPMPTNIFPIHENSTVYVEIRGFEFDPATLKVVNGTTVKWTNRDSAIHIVNGHGFQSPPLNKWDSWKYTFNNTGTFEYNCSNHQSMAHGWIIVE
jgi:plastocyanin